MAPSRQHDEAFVQWFGRLERASASPGAILALMRANYDIDVRHVLPAIQAPTLILHRVGDKTVPVERSRVVVAMGKKLGVEMKYIEVPNGSHGDVVAPHFKDVFDWFDAHKRKTAEEKAAAAGAKSN